MGLVNRLTPSGHALEAAVALAQEIAAFPPTCMRNDRRSALWQWGLPEPEALVLEARFGADTIASGETRAGAARFASGAGRHGSPVKGGSGGQGAPTGPSGPPTATAVTADTMGRS